MNQPAISPTLDTLFQRTLIRQPHAVALLDPLNKARVTGHQPRRMSYAEADTAIEALSAHFVESGLTDEILPQHVPRAMLFHHPS